MFTREDGTRERILRENVAGSLPTFCENCCKAAIEGARSRENEGIGVSGGGYSGTCLKVYLPRCITCLCVQIIVETDLVPIK